jgi:hypothetical protein
VLCGSIGDPPAQAQNAVIPPPNPNTSLRDQITALTEAPGTICVGCHSQFNPLGFAMGNFDGIGQWRSTDRNGKTVDASVTLMGPGDLAGVQVNGPVQLGKAIASSRVFRDCTIDKWFQFLSGRAFDTANGDQDTRVALQTEFDSSGRNIGELMVDLVSSDAFRYIRTPSP